MKKVTKLICAMIVGIIFNHSALANTQITEFPVGEGPILGPDMFGRSVDPLDGVDQASLILIYKLKLDEALSQELPIKFDMDNGSISVQFKYNNRGRLHRENMSLIYSPNRRKFYLESKASDHGSGVVRFTLEVTLSEDYSSYTYFASTDFEDTMMGEHDSSEVFKKGSGPIPVSCEGILSQPNQG